MEVDVAEISALWTPAMDRFIPLTFQDVVRDGNLPVSC